MFSYIPKPQHILIPTIILLLTAVVTGFFPSWQTTVAFIVIAIICTVTGISIAISIGVKEYSTYWENVGRDIDKLQKTPPELWGTLGFVTPPQTVTLRNEVTGDPGESMDYAMKVIRLSLSPEKMQIFANAILTGTKTLAESEWKDTAIGVDKARTVKQEMLDAGLIELRNPRNRLSGYMMTRKGILYLWEYASDYVRKELDLQVLLSHANPTPSEASLLSNIVS